MTIIVHQNKVVQDVSNARIEKVLKHEETLRSKAFEEISEAMEVEEQQQYENAARRSMPLPGAMGPQMLANLKLRLERQIEKAVELREESLRLEPKVHAKEHYDYLSEVLARITDAFPEALRQRLRFRGMSWYQMFPDEQLASEAARLKRIAEREIVLLRERTDLGLAPQNLEHDPTPMDSRRIFVVHGRNEAAREAMFTFLRSIGLDPIEWESAVALTGNASPYPGDVLEFAFRHAQAVLVLITGDDLARVGTRFLLESDELEERELTPQARPNVLFEAGMAFGTHPKRTLIVQIGKVRSFTDTVGRHIIRLSNKLTKRQALADRLRTAGCPVDLAGKSDWHNAGDFDSANLYPDSDH